MEKIAFAGIGNMGWPIAANLVRAGFDVAVTDLSAERVSAFVAEVGGSGAPSARDAVVGADALVTVLPTSGHVADVLRGVADGMTSGSVVVEMSSGDPSVTRTLASELATRSITLVDAPVSGGVLRAQNAELAIMTGGDTAALARVRPILEAVGASIHHCGPVGAGHAMKALNNLVSAAGFLIASEAVVVGREFGLDPAHMVEVLNQSSGMNYSTQNKFDRFVFSGAFDSGFTIGLMAKDLGIAAGLAGDVGVPAPFSALCARLWSVASETFGPAADHTEIARFCGIGEA